MKTIKTFSFIFLILFVSILQAQTIDSTSANLTNSYPSKINKTKLITSLSLQSGFFIGGMSYLQFIWYKDVPRVPFEFYNDNKGYLQMDKCGHAFGAYLESSISYNSLRNAGLSKTKSLFIGGYMGLILQTPIEIWDGMYQGWGFSWGDMIANASGSTLFTAQESLFNQQLLKYKFSYWESTYSRQANGYLGSTTLGKVFQDYNGHTYWLSAPVDLMYKKSPDWLNIAVGYSGNGMYGEFKNIKYYHGKYIPETTRYRQYLLSLDVDWTKIKTNSKVLNTVFKGLRFIKLPFPAIEYNSLGKFQAYWLYW